MLYIILAHLESPSAYNDYVFKGAGNGGDIDSFVTLRCAFWSQLSAFGYFLCCTLKCMGHFTTSIWWPHCGDIDNTFLPYKYSRQRKCTFPPPGYQMVAASTQYSAFNVIISNQDSMTLWCPWQGQVLHSAICMLHLTPFIKHYTMHFQPVILLHTCMDSWQTQWRKLPTGGHGHVICMGNLRGVFSQENTPEGCTEAHKSSFFPYK